MKLKLYINVNIKAFTEKVKPLPRQEFDHDMILIRLEYIHQFCYKIQHDEAKFHYVNLGFAAAGVGVPAEGIADYISKHYIHAHGIASFATLLLQALQTFVC